MIDASHHLQVYDVELIFSWTPSEFKNFVKGAQYRVIDEFERMARGAMMHRYAMNAKSVKEKKMFDAQKARERLTNGSEGWKDSRVSIQSSKRYKEAREALDNYLPQLSVKKGG